MTSPRTRSRLTGRTRIVTAASIGAVSLAGLFALGANLGILTSASRSPVGDVSAAGDLVPTDPRVVDVYLDERGDPPASTAAAPAASQRFAVGEAGTVDVSTDAGRARVDLVRPARGWTARTVRTTGADLAVAFTDGARTLELTATAGADGAVTAEVTESPRATPGPVRTPRHEADADDDDHGYEGGDSDD